MTYLVLIWIAAAGPSLQVEVSSLAVCRQVEIAVADGRLAVEIDGQSFTAVRAECRPTPPAEECIKDGRPA